MFSFVLKVRSNDISWISKGISLTRRKWRLKLPGRFLVPDKKQELATIQEDNLRRLDVWKARW
jgi:hypothetical protein